MKTKTFFLIFVFLHLTLANNNFENVICGSEISELFAEEYENLDKICIFNEIKSSADFENIFTKMQNGYQFYFDKCQYIRYSHTCERKRNSWNTYNEVIFYNSQLEKLSVNDFNLLAHIESLTAANVGLKELNRDDFKPYNKLLKLDISQNNLTYLGNMVFRHLESLEFLNLSKNKIKSIHIGSFDECSQTLKIIDLSYNNLIAFPANILDALSVAKLELHLQYNEIELMAVPIVNKDISLHTLDISNNKIKNFRFNCTEIETLWLNDNQLKEFLTPNCSIQNLHLSNNQLEELKIEKVSSLFLSQNFRLKKLLINDVSEIVSLEASDFNSNVITMAMLKNATQLINLDLSGTYIGPLAFDTFADMTELEELRLKNTGKNF
jgi:Leucine-rich repeat (LRR) protein